MSEGALSSSPPLRQAWVYVLMGAEVQEREEDTQLSLSQPALQVFPSEVRLLSHEQLVLMTNDRDSKTGIWVRFVEEMINKPRRYQIIAAALIPISMRSRSTVLGTVFLLAWVFLCNYSLFLNTLGFPYGEFSRSNLQPLLKALFLFPRELFSQLSFGQGTFGHCSF